MTRNEYDAGASQAHECAAQGPYCPMILPADSKLAMLCGRDMCRDSYKGWGAFAVVTPKVRDAQEAEFANRETADHVFQFSGSNTETESKNPRYFKKY